MATPHAVDITKKEQATKKNNLGLNMARPKGSKNPTAGRKKGVPNKLTTDLKQMILAAMEAAGGDAGSQGYLEEQAKKNPNAFLTLIGKILPTQVTGDSGGPVISRVEFVVVDPES